MIQKRLENNILILDGAMGTMIQRYHLSEDDYRDVNLKNHKIDLLGNNDLLSITNPKIIKEIHQAYVDAGSDIIETNTFSANSISQSDYDLSHLSYEMNLQSAKIAKEVASESEKKYKRKIYVAGAVGPTNRTASISPDVNDPSVRNISFDELVVAYHEQVQALVDGGCDIILVETIFDTLNAKAALFAISEVFEKNGIERDIMVSGTIVDNSGRTLSGQTLEAFLISISHLPLLSVGLNCALGAKAMLPYIQNLSDVFDGYISVYPNAGLPNAFGEYDQSPEEMAEELLPFLNLGLINIIGGCCGTTPEHIKNIKEIADNYAVRQLENREIENVS